MSRETIFSGANGDREKKHFPCSADSEQDRQQYPVDPYPAESADHTYRMARTFKLRNKSWRKPGM